jgi:phosphoribosylamine--glycine ligase
MSPKVLVLGSGGREHALLEALSRSPQAPELFVAPGNAGCYNLATGVDIQADDVPAVLNFVQAEDIDFVVVGPEAPLVAGVVDALEAQGILVFGPSQAAAQLEASKHYAKQIMAKAGVPTAGFAYCKTRQDAETALSQFKAPFVIKEDGLAAGKGVTVAETLAEAHEALARAEAKHSHVVIEEFLEGVELSVLAIADGKQAIPLISAQDFKRVGDHDTGENTGGMGAYAPVPFVDDTLLSTIQTTILEPMMKTLQAQNTPFKGILYAGLMIHPNGTPFVVEFNVRFGDPETQVVLPLLQDRIDVLALLMDSAKGELSSWRGVRALQEPTQKAVTVVMAASGYPQAYASGQVITLPDALPKGVSLFQAGTKRRSTGELISVGGRVLTVTAVADSLAEARTQAYLAIDTIDFPESFTRSDIALKASESTRLLR